MTPPDLLPDGSRRSFLKQYVATAAAFGAGVGQIAGASEPGPGRRAKVIDCHAHLTHRSRLTWEADDARLIAAADRLRIDQLCCSILTPRRPPTAEGFCECNQWVAEATERYRDRVLGYCYVNPGYRREAAEEIRRRVGDQGFVGVKLYNEFVCTDPIVFPM
jgi:hypothetical protein